ncbi:MAG TPA: L-ribulose-5-phosphate 4-epimerase [Anaerolineales bacterium]|nr:L-ribulose-5-phosphate 4-epimerase [Anaerolineales bacterium]
MLEKLKEELVQLHLELPKNNLVVWTGGNISARDPESGYVVIKPSGIRYEDLGPEHMVVLDLDGKIMEGDLKPSSDTASHLYIYKHRLDVGGVVHTHSVYATAFAAVNKPIPVVLTAIADEFGGPIPCGGFALIGDDAIGKVVVESIGKSPAVLLKNHGVFTIGKNARSAVKAAVMTEDNAKTVWLAMQMGMPDEIPQEDVEKLHHRYTHVYGQ